MTLLQPSHLQRGLAAVAQTGGVGQGSVFISRDAAGRIDPTVMPDAIETPRDNATNNRVIISSLTGRSRILKPVLR